jgi:hypothetical protein
MRILNRGGVDTRKLRAMIDSHLLGGYSVSTSTTSVTFVEKCSYGDGIHSLEFAAPRRSLYPERLCDLRRVAQLTLRDMLEREKFDYDSAPETREAA